MIAPSALPGHRSSPAPPQFLNNASNTTIMAQPNGLVAFRAVATDPAGGPLRYRLLTGPPGASLDSRSGAFRLNTTRLQQQQRRGSSSGKNEAPVTIAAQSTVSGLQRTASYTVRWSPPGASSASTTEAAGRTPPSAASPPPPALQQQQQEQALSPPFGTTSSAANSSSVSSSNTSSIASSPPSSDASGTGQASCSHHEEGPSSMPPTCSCKKLLMFCAPS